MELKKKPEADLTKKRGLFFNIGMVATLALVILAFTWKSYDEGDLMNLGSLEDIADEQIEVPITEQPPPPPPKIQQPEIIEVPDEEEIEEDIEVDLDVEVTEDSEIEEIIADEGDEEESDEIFTIVEDQPAPIGGYSAFYKYIGKKMKYPSQAKRMGIEGKVFMKFMVDKDGSISKVQVLKGIGAGCDEEATRVLKGAPKWKPGKQRGRPVRVWMNLPIVFKLN